MATHLTRSARRAKSLVEKNHRHGHTTPCAVPELRGSKQWVRFPLRLDDSAKWLPQCESYMFEHKIRDRPVIAFHNTKLENLVQAHQYELQQPCASYRGVLFDQRLRYGRGTHCGCKGVNVYADGGLETFDGYEGWVQLEVQCQRTTTLKGGRRRRYCVRGTSDEPCLDVVLLALWVPLAEVPTMVLFT